MRYFKYLLALAALTFAINPVLAQSVGTYTESANYCNWRGSTGN